MSETDEVTFTEMLLLGRLMASLLGDRGEMYAALDGPGVKGGFHLRLDGSAFFSDPETAEAVERAMKPLVEARAEGVGKGDEKVRLRMASPHEPPAPSPGLIWRDHLGIMYICGTDEQGWLECSEHDVFTLEVLQSQLKPWAEHNFGERPSWMPLMGALEELGELAHAHLKASQGIRTSEDHHAAKVDALADIIVYLADYANVEGIDLHEAVEQTWAKVRRRDWKADPSKGGTTDE